MKIGKKMIHRAGAEWLKRGVLRKECTRANVERGTQRVGPLRKNLRTHHEGKRGTKNVGDKRPLYVRKKRATANGIGGGTQDSCHLWEEEDRPTRPPEKTLELEFVKRANGMCSGFRKMRTWILWRSWPPPKRKKRSCTE
jgi:hypothetical protein